MSVMLGVNRYAVAAAGLSAGLSLHTIASLPRGGLARNWGARETLARRAAPPAMAQARPAPAPAAPPTIRRWFPERPPERPAHREPAAGRPDSTGLVSAPGSTEGPAYAGAGPLSAGPAEAGGELTAFSWQQAPRLRREAGAVEDLPVPAQPRPAGDVVLARLLSGSSAVPGARIVLRRFSAAQAAYRDPGAHLRAAYPDGEFAAAPDLRVRGRALTQVLVDAVEPGGGRAPRRAAVVFAWPKDELLLFELSAPLDQFEAARPAFESSIRDYLLR